jgi:hypothetical protein
LKSEIQKIQSMPKGRAEAPLKQNFLNTYQRDLNLALISKFFDDFSMHLEWKLPPETFVFAESSKSKEELESSLGKALCQATQKSLKDGDSREDFKSLMEGRENLADLYAYFDILTNEKNSRAKEPAQDYNPLAVRPASPPAGSDLPPEVQDSLKQYVKRCIEILNSLESKFSSEGKEGEKIIEQFKMIMQVPGKFLDMELRLSEGMSSIANEALMKEAEVNRAALQNFIKASDAREAAIKNAFNQVMQMYKNASGETLQSKIVAVVEAHNSAVAHEVKALADQMKQLAADVRPKETASHIFPNGEKYVGAWLAGKPNGQGTITRPNGEKYEGAFLDGEPNGQGALTLPDGSKCVGAFVNGKIYGQGTKTWPDGRKYEGAWVDGKRHDQGTMTLPDGQKYEGAWVDNKSHGQGTHTWPSGQKYVGAWVDGKRHGHGTYTWPSGEKYVGAWVDDKKHGQGTMTFPDGSKYVGAWVDGKRHGHGTETLPDGSKYVGAWVNNARPARPRRIFSPLKQRLQP